MRDMESATSDLLQLEAIFATRPALHRQYLEEVLQSFGSLSAACEFLSCVSDADIPPETMPSSAYATSTIEQLYVPAPSSAIHIDWTDEAAVRTMMQVSLAIVVPLVRERVCGLPLPDVEETADRVQYRLTNMTVTSFNLRERNVFTDIYDGVIHITADDVDLDVNIGNWSYRMRFLPVKDNGSARLAFRGVQARIIMTQEGDNMSLSQCTCNVTGSITLRTNDSRLSWVYNSIASVARSALRRNVETTLQNALRQALEEQL